MGRTACMEPQCLYKGALSIFLSALFNDVHYWSCLLSVNERLKDWQNSTDRGKTKYKEKKKFQYGFIQQKSHIEWPVFRPGPSCWKAADNWAIAQPERVANPVRNSKKEICAVCSVLPNVMAVCQSVCRLNKLLGYFATCTIRPCLYCWVLNRGKSNCVSRKFWWKPSLVVSVMSPSQFRPSFLSALQPCVIPGLLNSQSPLLSVFPLLYPLLYLHYFKSATKLSNLTSKLL